MNAEEKRLIDNFFANYTYYTDRYQLDLQNQRSEWEDFRFRMERGMASGVTDPQAHLEDLLRELHDMEYGAEPERLAETSHGFAMESFRDGEADAFLKISPVTVYNGLVANYTAKYKQDAAKEVKDLHSAYLGASLAFATAQAEGKSEQAVDAARRRMDFTERHHDVFKRWVANDRLLTADCINLSHANMPIIHPDITNKAIETQRAEHAVLSGEKAFEVYRSLYKERMDSFTVHDLVDWRMAHDDIVSLHESMLMKLEKRPSRLANIASVGKADKEWESELNSIRIDMGKAIRDFMEIDKERHASGSAVYMHQARVAAEKEVSSVFPDLFGKAIKYMNVSWRETQEKLRNQSQNQERGIDGGITR